MNSSRFRMHVCNVPIWYRAHVRKYVYARSFDERFSKIRSTKGCRWAPDFYVKRSNQNAI